MRLGSRSSSVHSVLRFCAGGAALPAPRPCSDSIVPTPAISAATDAATIANAATNLRAFNIATLPRFLEQPTLVCGSQLLQPDVPVPDLVVRRAFGLKTACPLLCASPGVIVDHHTEHPPVQHVNEGIPAS